MSDLFFTTNKTTTDASKAEPITSIDLQTYAGQEDVASFRIGNSGGNESFLLYSSDPNLSLSFHESRGFAPAIDYTAHSGTVGETVFLKVTPGLNPAEGERVSSIVSTVANFYLSVNYFLASTDEGDTEVSKLERFTGDETLNILQQFEDVGESVVLTRYDPITKPIGTPTNPVSKRFWDSINDPAEWCNPKNSKVGYRLVESIATKAFIGDQELDQNTLHDFVNGQLTFSDETRILLSPDFPGFNPKPIHTKVLFGSLTFQTPTFQTTQWTVKRHNGEFALINIRESKYFRGQFLYYSANLVRINRPGVGSDVGFLPWNQLYDESGKIVYYVKSHSVSEDPYCDDPYDPYCLTISEGLQTAVWDNGIVFTDWKGE